MCIQDKHTVIPLVSCIAYFFSESHRYRTIFCESILTIPLALHLFVNVPNLLTNILLCCLHIYPCQEGDVSSRVCVFVCLSVCAQDNLQSYEQILIRFLPQVHFNPKNNQLNISVNPQHNPNTGIFLKDSLTVLCRTSSSPKPKRGSSDF